MNQVKYLLTACAIIVLLAFAFFIVNLISSTEIISKPTVVVDYETTLDSAAVLHSKGRMLFQQNCASCHAIHKNLTGPALLGVEERGPWTERKNLIAWINNPSVFMEGSAYTKSLQKEYGIIMTAFPNLWMKKFMQF